MLIERSGAYGFEVALEHRVGNGGGETLLGEIGEAVADAGGTGGHRAEIDQANLRPALPRQHADQVGVAHWIERVILERTFVQRERADE